MKTTIEMAREVGLEDMWELTPRFVERLKAFEALVAAAEREESAKFFDDNEAILFWGSTVAEHIRARGNT